MYVYDMCDDDDCLDVKDDLEDEFDTRLVSIVQTF